MGNSYFYYILIHILSQEMKLTIDTNTIQINKISQIKKKTKIQTFNVYLHTKRH